MGWARGGRRKGGLPAAIAGATMLLVVAASGCSPAQAGNGASLPAHPGPASPGPASPAATPLLRSPTPEPPAYVPMVPIVAFWSGQRGIDRADLAALLAGNQPGHGPRYSSIAVSRADAAGLARAIGQPLGSAVRLLDPAAVRAAIRADANALGVIRAEDVEASVRALAVDGFSLFGSGRMRDPSAWPFSVPSSTPSSFEPGGVWTLAAGGDVNLDREVYVHSIKRGQGPDYPWDGGSARITGFGCCGPKGGAVVAARRTGNAGSFRNLLSGTDLALVNLEGMAASDFVYRPNGYTFSVDPDLLAGVRNAGIDAVGLANNHTLDAGARAVSDTCRKLDELGVAHAGAGENVTAALRAAWLRAAGLRVAFLSFDALESWGWARAGKAGAAPLELDVALRAIREARDAGADFVIVMPHWGGEYTTYVAPVQRRQAQAMAAAGADVILGSHSHYAGGMQSFTGSDADSVLTFYSLGNLLFDFSYDQWTQQAVVAVLTFDGDRLVQVDLRPTVVVDDSQVNLLDPATQGAPVLARMRAASGRYLGW